MKSKMQRVSGDFRVPAGEKVVKDKMEAPHNARRSFLNEVFGASLQDLGKNPFLVIQGPLFKWPPSLSCWCHQVHGAFCMPSHFHKAALASHPG